MSNPESLTNHQKITHIILTSAEKQQIRDLYAKKIEQKAELPNEHYFVSLEFNETVNLKSAKQNMYEHLSNNLEFIAQSMFEPLEHFAFLWVSEKGNKVEFEVKVKGVKIEMEQEDNEFDIEGFDDDIEQSTFLDYIYKTIGNGRADLQNVTVNPI
jgi:hypothetical protein